MSKEKWRYLFTPELSAAMNMALDEAILTLHSEGKVPPTVRFYTWQPATLSIGYFQKVEQEVDLDQVRARGLGFVRRPTGGRAVLHDQELTYSVVVSEKHPKFPASVIESYQVISLGLMEGFRQLGLHAEMMTDSTPGASLPSRSVARGRTGSAVCFDTPSWYELLVEGKKVAGSAQTRQKGTILQHGAILLDLDADLYFDVLKFPSPAVKEKLRVSFDDKAVAINQLLEEPIGVREAEQAFLTGFQRALDVELVKNECTSEEWELARRLVATRYGTDEWNFSR